MATEVLTTESQQDAGFLDTESNRRPRDVVASLNYYNDPGDGSPPHPVFIGG